MCKIDRRGGGSKNRSLGQTPKPMFNGRREEIEWGRREGRKILFMHN